MTDGWREVHAQALDADVVLIDRVLDALAELERRFGDVDPLVMEARQWAGAARMRRNDCLAGSRELRLEPPVSVLPMSATSRYPR